MVVVDHFPGLDHPERRLGLGRGPPAGGGNTDQDGWGTVAAGKGIALSGKKAKLPVQGEIGRLFTRTGGQAVFASGRLFRVDGILAAPGEQGQQERKDERVQFHDTNVRKKSGQTADFDNLSAWAPPSVESLNTW